MGNYISCSLSGPLAAGKQSSRGIKVIFPNGELKHFYQPIKAAEIMLEKPGFFPVNTKSLQMGRRFSALNADEDLEIANVYVMFPMKRVNSLLTAADMGALFLTANSAAKRASLGRVRILPECDQIQPEVAPPPRLNLEDIEEFSTPEFKHRLSTSRSKKPLLATIAEEREPICSR